jgi:hypothetical protein
MAKDCGDCGLCCKLMGVASLDKAQGRWCGHFRRASGCDRYETRPGDCRAFNCTWLLTEALDARWKPTTAGFLMHSEGQGGRLVVECDPARPHDWRREPYRSVIRGWAASGQVEVLVFAGRKGVRLGPDGSEGVVRRA